MNMQKVPTPLSSPLHKGGKSELNAKTSFPLLMKEGVRGWLVENVQPLRELQ
jgi:hypothetical protein